jgi:hypothetical protein
MFFPQLYCNEHLLVSGLGLSPVLVSETRREYFPVGSSPASMRAMVSDTNTGLIPASSVVYLNFFKSTKGIAAKIDAA